MKTVAVVGIKTNNLRLPGKNTRALCGVPLYAHLWETLRQCRRLDRVLVDSSDPLILAAAQEWGFAVNHRDPALNGPETSGHDLIAALLPHLAEDVVAQIFVTTPLLPAETIDRAVAALADAPDADSVVPVYPVWDRFWYKGAPVSHDPGRLVGTQFMEPVYREAGFYVFRKDAFVREGTRVTRRHVFVTTTAEDCADIDVEADFLYAQALLEARRAAKSS